jgi:hypothetical protein
MGINIYISTNKYHVLVKRDDYSKDKNVNGNKQLRWSKNVELSHLPSIMEQLMAAVTVISKQSS